tara:strand:- start:190 stop:339 length:150 start_codon:yes stop_codon:yes gene_type:complete
MPDKHQVEVAKPTPGGTVTIEQITGQPSVVKPTNTKPASKPKANTKTAK